MGSVRMFRDRVVSMEQTQEIGESHIELLTALAVEALPGYDLTAHGLEHERDHYWLSLSNAETGRTCRIAFTRMFLSDASRLPAVVADAKAPVRAQIVGCIRGQAGRTEILVGVAGLLTEEESREREEIDAEWRKKHEAAQAARRAEEERRAREHQRQKQQEEAHRQAQRDRERREKPAVGGVPGQQPAPGGERGRVGRRRRRGRGGVGGNAGGGRPQEPQAASRSAPTPPQDSPRPPQPANAPLPEAARAEGKGGRRRRRRGRGRGPGGPKPGGGGAEPSESSGGSN